MIDQQQVKDCDCIRTKGRIGCTWIDCGMTGIVLCWMLEIRPDFCRRKLHD